MIKLIQKLFKRKQKKVTEETKSHITDEFYSIIKLVSGEEIFSLVMIDEEYEDPILILQNPITVRLITNSQGSFIKVKPWIEMSNEDIFILCMSKVITMTEVNDSKLIEVYKNYSSSNSLDDCKNDSQKVKISSKMGYISSVSDARKKLEDIFKL